jgi:hypothetical protein
MDVRRQSSVLDFLSDQNFLQALAALVGPLAFFAAPTEEIEQLVYCGLAEDLEPFAAPQSSQIAGAWPEAA